jgi:hypothetical protein
MIERAVQATKKDAGIATIEGIGEGQCRLVEARVGPSVVMGKLAERI